MAAALKQASLVKAGSIPIKLETILKQMFIVCSKYSAIIGQFKIRVRLLEK